MKMKMERKLRVTLKMTSHKDMLKALTVLDKSELDYEFSSVGWADEYIRESDDS